MFIRPIYRKKDGKRHAYWALVESYRTPRGSRQRIVAYVGRLDEAGRLGVERAAQGNPRHSQGQLFEQTQPEWVEVDVSRMAVENRRQYGGPWLALELLRKLELDQFLQRTVARGQEDVPWWLMSLVLVIARLCEPSSELYIAEHLWRHSALAEVLGIPADKVNDDRLYRALDRVLPHKAALEVFLKERLGNLFDLEYDLLLYDVTSTYFEGQAQGNPLAQRGYSRDHRPDCKQVCLGLVVSRCGMPLGYEVFAGNTADVKTLAPMVQTMEGRYGRADRIWVFDRGLVSKTNMKFLQEGGRRYIVATPKGMLKEFEQQILQGDWATIREGLEVKLCRSPDGDETFILCRSRDRQQKERAMHERFEQRIEQGLRKMAEGCRKKKYQPTTIAKRVGRLMQKNSRAAGLFEVKIQAGQDGRTQISWQKREAWRDWAALSEGCYLLRSNVIDWTPQDLWRAYMQLTEAEGAFRINKSDLGIRPIWHQKQERVLAHILVCFLAYVLWKTLDRLCQQAHLGDEPRRVFDELRQIELIDVVLPTKKGITIRQRCITRPDEHQAILLDCLGLHLPGQFKMTAM